MFLIPVLIFSNIGRYLLFTVENLGFISYKYECFLFLPLVQLKTLFLATLQQKKS